MNWVESQPDSTRVVAAGELLEPGEVTLGPGESYATPWVYAAYSADGTDGLSRKFHRTIRDRPGHPATPRPVVLNTWEAVYFDHDLDTLIRLADVAAELGVERFVLDDGWFGGRRNDTTSLGDWFESPDVWPDGLGPLVDRVQGLGMQFGLWVEPEMVNPRLGPLSAASRLGTGRPATPPAAREAPVRPRRRQARGLRLPVREAGCTGQALPDRLPEVGPQPGSRGAGARRPARGPRPDPGRVRPARPAPRRQPRAGDRELRERRRPRRSGHPGANRPGVGQRLQRRAWSASPSNAGTRLLLPLELMGCHVGPPRSHTTSRTHDLSFRAATALFGHFGIEWDIASADASDRAALAAVIAEYRRLRPLLHAGELVTADHPDPSAAVYGVVATDRSHAVFCYAQLSMTRFETPLPATIPGLDPERTYLVERLAPAGGPRLRERAPAPWVTHEGFRANGATLGAIGLAMPLLEPEQALLLEFTAV